MRIAKAGAKRCRHVPMLGAAAEDEKVQGAEAGEYQPERLLGQIFGLCDRPSPNAIGQAQQRAAMRHAGKAEAALAVGVDDRLARQMRFIRS